jgi:D-alanyl-D-alanine carboxypeptidase
MNDLVESLGLTDTHFVNPHGLDNVTHYSSAYDVAAIGGELLSIPALAEIVSTQSYTPFGWTDGPLENINLLLTTYPGAIGIKTGFTDQAGQTIVGAAQRDGRTLVVSIMRSEDVYVDASRLLDWAFENTEPACGLPPAAATP